MNGKTIRRALRKHAEQILTAAILAAFFLVLGFAGSYEVGEATTGQTLARVIPTLAVMALSFLGLKRLEGKGGRHE